jgi:hypothetical protein
MSDITQQQKIDWLESQAEDCDEDADLWVESSDIAHSKRLEAIKFRQCADQLRDQQGEAVGHAFESDMALLDIGFHCAKDRVFRVKGGDIRSIEQSIPLYTGTLPAAKVEVPNDYRSHHDDFRLACQIAKDNAAPSSEDMDDAGYWQHQIDTLDAIKAQQEAG